MVNAGLYQLNSSLGTVYLSVFRNLSSKEALVLAVLGILSTTSAIISGTVVSHSSGDIAVVAMNANHSLPQVP